MTAVAAAQALSDLVTDALARQWCCEECVVESREAVAPFAAAVLAALEGHAVIDGRVVRLDGRTRDEVPRG